MNRSIRLLQEKARAEAKLQPAHTIVAVLVALCSIPVFCLPARAQSGAPSAPTNVTATALDSAVSLSWSASSGAQFYTVKRSLGTGGPYLIVNQVTSTSCIDKGLQNGITFFYVITATGGGVQSGPSAEVSVKPQPVPLAPTGLTASSGSGQMIGQGPVTLTWNPSACAASYNVKRSPSVTGPFSTVASPADDNSGNPQSWTDSTAYPGSAYYYIVTAVNTSGESTNSGEEAASVWGGGSATPPTPPDGVTQVELAAPPAIQLVDLYLPHSLVLMVGADPNGYPIPCHLVWGRDLTNGFTAGLGENIVTDTTPLTTGTAYTYSVRVVPNDPDNVQTVNGVSTQYIASEPQSVTFTPYQATATLATAPVDSRLDPRFGNPTFLNHVFSKSVYHGGLWCGNSVDPSRSGRSFLRFTLPAISNTDTVVCGNVQAFLTTASSSSPAAGWPVGCQAVADNGWTTDTIGWNNAPAMDPTAAQSISYVPFDSSNPAGYWVRWPLMDGITSFAGGTLHVGLSSPNETHDQNNNVDSWLYLSRAGGGNVPTPSTPAPTVVFAVVSGTHSRYSVGLDNNPLQGGTNTTLTAALNQPLSSDVRISFTSSDPSIPAPAAITIPAGHTSGTTTLTTSTVTANTYVTLTASSQVVGTATVQVTVTP